MEDIPTMTATSTGDTPLSFLEEMMDRYEQMMHQYWGDNPDLQRIVQQRKQKAAALILPETTPENDRKNIHTNHIISTETNPKPLLLGGVLRGAPLRARITESQHEIRQRVLATGVDIIPRTQAHNRKSSHQTVEEERQFRADVVEAQIKSWRSLLPDLIRRFSKIPDYRRASSTKHKMTVLMFFGLFAFIFRLSSRREMNRELTSPVIYDHLKKIFPEIDTIPHADTLARALEHINPKEIEAIHMSFLRELIKKKKFRKLFIQDCVPITIDGTQKLYRDGLLQDSRWCERNVGHPEEGKKQQYIYAVEANITLRNGLTIPLMTEYLTRENNQLMQTEGKQDSETTAFERLSKRLKKYFPRLKLILFMDAMYATQPVMEILNENNWEYIIRLPKKKLTDFSNRLNDRKSMSIPIPGQASYRKRKQEFYWENNITYGYEWQLNIHLAGCLERYKEADKKTGEIVERFSEHAWISGSLPESVGAFSP